MSRGYRPGGLIGCKHPPALAGTLERSVELLYTEMQEAPAAVTDDEEPSVMMQDEYTRYLKLLNALEGPPSVASLKDIVRAHLATIPFENISKLIRWKTTRRCEFPSLAQYLDGIERYHFGGTCYSNNYYLNQLLACLGYEVRLCGADMNRPDVHVVNLVRLDGREYLVDVGYAAPFLEPMPRDLSEDFVVSLGSDRYILRPQDAEGRSRLEFYRDGTSRHGYIVKPTPRRIEEFSDVIADSFRPEATFMNTVLIVRFDADCSYVIHNMEFIETQGASTNRTTFHTIDELVRAIGSVFGMPPVLVRHALEGFLFQGNAWG